VAADKRATTAELKVRTMTAVPRSALLLPAVLLLAGAAWGQSLPDPIPLAVLGRPLSEIRPSHHSHEKHAVANATGQPNAGKPHHHHASTQPLVARVAPVSAPLQHAAKPALDDRADPNVRVDDVGQGTHFARKALGTGVYIGDSHREAVLRYFAEHPAPPAPVEWKVGEPLPRGAQVTGLPAGLTASLPHVPPGYRYVELGGDVVMIASGSELVVDGVSRTRR
jgi:hypothetical protein